MPYPAGMTSPTDPHLPLRVAIVGCGNIAGPYARSIAAHDEVELVAVTDVDPARAAAFGAEHGCRVHDSLEALLADPDVQLVVNLTVHHAHYAVSRQALEAGKHVYSEKPMALEAAEARELVDAGSTAGGAPGLRALDVPRARHSRQPGRSSPGGELGTVRAVYADVNWGRIEAWHPAPIPFYDVGVLVDVGVYPLTIATAFLGPAVAVEARGWDLLPDRVTTSGERFRIGSPDLIVAAVELASGAVMRLTGSFYVGRPDPRARPARVPRRRRLARAWPASRTSTRRSSEAPSAGSGSPCRTCASRTAARTGGAASPTWRGPSWTARRSG